MGHVGDFAWDEMFVFGPYSPKGEICRTLNLSASRCSVAGIKDVDVGDFLLVFMQNGAVSETLNFPRTIADFDESGRCLAKAIGRDAAVFTLERKLNRVYLLCRHPTALAKRQIELPVVFAVRRGAQGGDLAVGG